MSFLGVGAPEALLVGIVALVVFGPKGLADVGGMQRNACMSACMCVHVCACLCMPGWRLGQRVLQSWVVCSATHACLHVYVCVRARALVGGRQGHEAGKLL
eukprot:361927-Chlamydomonas_euryale.AAC.13